jgi:hypothetical protein
MDATTAAYRRLKQGTLIVQFVRNGLGVRVYTTRGPGGKAIAPKRLRTSSNAKGYPRVEICYRGKRYTVLLHRLAWMARHGRCLDAADEVHHDDEDKRNARPGNLVRASREVNLAIRNEANDWDGPRREDLDEDQLDEFEAEQTAAFLAS